VAGSTTVGGMSVAVVHVTWRYGALVPGSATHDPGGANVVALLAPAGFVQLLSIQFGAVPGVKPSGPHPAAVVNTVWLFAPGGKVHVVS
jgi:hypothetical protein